MSNKLEDFRQSIDLIDNCIVRLIAERMRVVKKVGKWKKAKGIQPLDSKRWYQVLSEKKKIASDVELDPMLISDIYELMHEHALKLEEKV